MKHMKNYQASVMQLDKVWRYIPALRMLSTEVGNDIENPRVGALRVILQDAHIDILKADKHISSFRVLLH